MPPRGTRNGDSQRYGHYHRRKRQEVAPQVEAGGVSCYRCHQPIQPGSKWHLDHNDNGGGYAGVSHEYCNTSIGAQHARANDAMRRNTMSNDTLYAGRDNASAGTVSNNGRMVSTGNGAWISKWIYESIHAQ